MMEKKKVPKLEQIKNWGWAKKDKMLLRVLGVRGYLILRMLKIIKFQVNLVTYMLDLDLKIYYFKV